MLVLTTVYVMLGITLSVLCILRQVLYRVTFSVPMSVFVVKIYTEIDLYDKYIITFERLMLRMGLHAQGSVEVRLREAA